jgi:hypothetical protein
VEDEAGGGVGVVGDLGALVGQEGYGGIGVAGGDGGDSAGGEERAEADSEGQSEVFFDEMVVEGGAGLWAAMGGVEEDNRSGCGLLGGELRGEARQEDEDEAADDVLRGSGQGERVVACRL